MNEKETKKIIVAFDTKFLKEVDNNWRNENFKSRSEYILYLVRNDLKKVQ